MTDNISYPPNAHVYLKAAHDREFSNSCQLIEILSARDIELANLKAENEALAARVAELEAPAPEVSAAVTIMPTGETTTVLLDAAD